MQAESRAKGLKKRAGLVFRYRITLCRRIVNMCRRIAAGKNRNVSGLLQWVTLTRVNRMKHYSLHLLGGVVMFALAILLGLVALHFFGAHVAYLSQSVLPEINGGMLFLMVAINDFLVTPVSPDIAIFLISQKSPGSYMLIASLGAASVMGGVSAWVCGRYLENKFKVAGIEKFVSKNHALINKYGVWVVALGALTPLPYSLTCWAAGALKMDFSGFFAMILFRIPRFLLYFHFFSISANLLQPA